MPPDSEIAFDIREVSYSYDKIAALHNVSLQVKRGERVALLGANGSGKSTLLRLLAALAFPDQGGIAFFDETLTPSRLAEQEFFYRFRRRVGVLFQNPDVQLFNASVFDEVAFAPLQLRWPKDEIRQRVEETLCAMGIADLRNRAPHRLSVGEKKRVALASVLVIDPEVLLLDEPTAALDPGSQTQITELLASWTGGSKTVITATHDLDALENIADRCYLLENGSLAARGTPLAILHDVALLERTKLIRPHHHVHNADSIHPHPHVHRHEVT